MAEDQKAGIMLQFVESIASQDFQKALSLCTDDVIWANPAGTFKGKEDVERYLRWNASKSNDMKISESGIGILVDGGKAFFEHEISGTFDGEKVAFLGMCTYEFSEDKIKSMRTVFDRLTIAQQASSKWLPKKMVNTVIGEMQKGLD